MLKKVGKFVLTDDTLDRHGDRILPGGVDVSAFKNNPVMFYNHMKGGRNIFGENQQMLPIGKWKNIRRMNGQLTADAYVDTGQPLGAEIARLVELGIINTTSVGIIPLAISDSPDDKVTGQTGYTITKSELLEASIVDIPANPSAVRLDKQIEKSADGSVTPKEGAFLVKNLKIQKVEKMNIVERLNKLFGLNAKTEEEALEKLESANISGLVDEAVEKAVSEKMETATDAEDAPDVEALDKVNEDLKAVGERMEKLEADLAALKDGNDKVAESMKSISGALAELKGQRGDSAPPADRTVPVMDDKDASDEVDDAQKKREVTQETIKRLQRGLEVTLQ